MKNITSIASETAELERNNPPTGDSADKANLVKIKQAGIFAIWSPINMAWVIAFGDSLIDLDGTWFFPTRDDLRSHIVDMGLKLTSKNELITS